MTNPEVTILIPNYRTPEITKLCFRLLRKHTDFDKARVIAIDNGSQDASTDYLRSLNWITLIERFPGGEESPSRSHALALDQALEQVSTPYVLSFHTDTFVRSDQWLDFLLKEIRRGPNVAGVGSWKMETKSFYKKVGKRLEWCWQSLVHPLLGKRKRMMEGRGNDHYYLRSHCALYRMDLIGKYGLSFGQGHETAGKVMHKTLVEKGHQMVFLPADQLDNHIMHLNHATMVLNPNLGSRKRSIKKGLKRIKKRLQEVDAEQVLNDESLDC